MVVVVDMADVVAVVIVCLVILGVAVASHVGMDAITHTCERYGCFDCMVSLRWAVEIKLYD